MIVPLWGRITGADKDKKFPNQQGSVLGRLGDHSVIFPYGSFADLPNNTLFLEIKPGVVIPVTIKRPSDTETGEPVFFHPETNTRMIFRNSGDLDIDTVDAKGNVNINTIKANITASEEINLTAPLTKVTGAFEVDGPSNLKGKTNLGIGGPAIARVGDSVVAGVITTGSTNHTAD